MSIERKQIVKPFLLLCEGKDAEGFLISYLNSNELSTDRRFSNEIQVFDFGGNEELVNFLTNLTNMDKYEQVTSLAIIRDAEKDFSKACLEITNALSHSDLSIPNHCGKWVHNDTEPNIGYILFPLNNEAGTLEDLCLKILAEDHSDAILSAIDSFLTTMESTCKRHYTQKHKNRLHTYFSTSDKYVTRQLGLASRSGAFDWSSSHLNPLKRFLTDGFDESSNSSDCF